MLMYIVYYLLAWFLSMDVQSYDDDLRGKRKLVGTVSNNVVVYLDVKINTNNGITQSNLYFVFTVLIHYSHFSTVHCYLLL